MLLSILTHIKKRFTGNIVYEEKGVFFLNNEIAKNNLKQKLFYSIS
jgi:hypothetical protein